MAKTVCMMCSFSPSFDWSVRFSVSLKIGLCEDRRLKHAQRQTANLPILEDWRLATKTRLKISIVSSEDLTPCDISLISTKIQTPIETDTKTHEMANHPARDLKRKISGWPLIWQLCFCSCSDNSQNLYISNAESADAGAYKCQAENRFATVLTQPIQVCTGYGICSQGRVWLIIWLK